MPPLAIMAGVAVAGSIGGAAISSHAAGSAADKQVQAANDAAHLQKQAADEALAFQKQQWNTQQGQMQPWLQSGTAGLANLDYLMGITPSDMTGTPGQAAAAPGQPPMARPGQPLLGPRANMDSRDVAMRGGQPMTLNPDGSTFRGATPPPTGTPTGPNLAPLVNTSLGAKGSLLQPFGEQFQAPTDVTEQNDPGYKTRLATGMKLLQNSAAAKGTLLNGGTGKDITQFGQDYASNEYGNVYNRAFNEYAQRYNQYNQGKSDIYNRLAALSGTGQVAANQLGLLGQDASHNVGNILMNSAQQIGQNINNAGAARASGIVGSGNAWGGAVSNIGNLAMLLPYLQQMQYGSPGNVGGV